MTEKEEFLLKALITEVSNIAKELKSFNDYMQNPARIMESWINQETEEKMSEMIDQQMKVFEKAFDQQD